MALIWNEKRPRMYDMRGLSSSTVNVFSFRQ